MGLLGSLLKLAYQLNRHRWLEVPLDRWLVAFTLGGAVGTACGWLPGGWPVAGLWLVLAVVLTVGLLLARWAGYVAFRPAPAPLANPSLLPAEVKVRTWVTGHLEVEGKRCYMAGLIAAYQTMDTREHIIVAWNPASRFLLAGSDKRLDGMWYAFIAPSTIRDLVPGHLWSGRRPRLAVRVAYGPRQGKASTLYLAFEDEAQQQIVLADLLKDANI